MIPVTTMVYSVELLLRTMQGIQQMAQQGIHVMAAAPPARPNKDVEEKRGLELQEADSRIGNTNPGSRTASEEDKTLNENYNYCNPDPNAGQCLKLWRYKVLFIKRDFEHAFDEAEDLVSDNVSDITAWKIAEFIQKLHNRRVLVPVKWIDKGLPKLLKYLRIDKETEAPESYKVVEKAHNEHKPIYLVGLPEDDKKYLRLFSQVLAEYTREEPEYDKEQVDVLRDIARRIGEKSGAAPK